MPNKGEEGKLARYVAGEGWLGAYLAYATKLTDAPAMFHLAAGMIALAGAVGSRISWTGGGGRESWPNLYVLLLAPSGLYRKSTSVDLACSLLNRASPETVMDREFSPERFIANLAEHPTSVLKEAEFASLLERMKQSYMQGLKQKLTELYDCTPEYTRNVQGAEGGNGGKRLRIVRPALSILAASTTDWLVASITEMDLRSGFLPRFLLIPAYEREPEPKGGYWAEASPLAENTLVKELAKKAQMMPLTKLHVTEVRKYLVAWDERIRKRYEKNENGDISGVYSRLAHSVAKITALLAVSELKGPTYEATIDMAERATALMEWILTATEKVFEEHLVFEKFERSAQKALRLIPTKEEGGIDRGSLLRAMRMPTRQLDEITKALQERGQLDRPDQIATGGRYRTMLYRIGEESAESGGKSGGKFVPDEIPDVIQQAWDSP